MRYFYLAENSGFLILRTTHDRICLLICSDRSWKAPEKSTACPFSCCSGMASQGATTGVEVAEGVSCWAPFVVHHTHTCASNEFAVLHSVCWFGTVSKSWQKLDRERKINIKPHHTHQDLYLGGYFGTSWLCVRQRNISCGFRRAKLNDWKRCDKFVVSAVARLVILLQRCENSCGPTIGDYFWKWHMVFSRFAWIILKFLRE